jgi:CBS domain-containing protein
MLVHELMSTPALSLPLGSAVDDAVTLLAARQISAVPIVDVHDEVVGIVSEADLLGERLVPDPRVDLGATPGPEDPWHRLVDEVMTPDPVTVRENGDVAEVAALLADTGWKSVPVVRGRRRLVGVISRSDIVRALARPDAEIAARVTEDLADINRPSWRVSVSKGVVTVQGPTPGREAMLATVVARAATGVRRVVVEPWPDEAAPREARGSNPRRSSDPAGSSDPAHSSDPGEQGDRLALRNLRRWPRQPGGPARTQ